MKPEISIIMPTYNSKKFIDESLGSIKKQTEKPSKFETIIYDDGSVDDTVKIIKTNISKTNKHNFRLFFYDKNKGQSITRNQAIEVAKGKYIILLDSDDLLESHAVESTLKFMDKNPNVHYSYSQHKRINEGGKFICNRPSFKFSKEKLFHFNYIGHLKCFSKEIHQKIGGYDERIPFAQDWDHVLRASMVLNKDQIKQNPEYLYRYRVHLNSISKTKNEERKEMICKFLEGHLKKLEINAEVFWSHERSDLYNYFDWRIK